MIKLSKFDSWFIHFCFFTVLDKMEEINSISRENKINWYFMESNTFCFVIEYFECSWEEEEEEKMSWREKIEYNKETKWPWTFAIQSIQVCNFSKPIKKLKGNSGKTWPEMDC